MDQGRKPTGSSVRPADPELPWEMKRRDSGEAVLFLFNSVKVKKDNMGILTSSSERHCYKRRLKHK